METRPRAVLLVVSTRGFADESAAYAIERAAAGPAGLDVLLVCEPESGQLSERLSERGWLGDKTTGQISHTLSKDRRTRGYRILSGIARDAEAEDVPVQTHVAEGEAEGEVRKFLRKHPVAEIVLSAPAPGFLERLFAKSRRDMARRLGEIPGITVKEFHYE